MGTPQGPSTRGNAGVYGGSINPLSLYIQQGANRQAREAMVAEQERKKRDEAIKDLRAWNPDKVWDDVYDVVNQYVQRNVRDRTSAMLDAGMPINQVQREADRSHGEANTIIAKLNGLGKVYKESGDAIDKNDFILNKGYYHSLLNDERDKIRTSAAAAIKTGQMAPYDDNVMRNISMADPTGWDVNKIVTEHLKGLGEQIKTQDAAWKDDAKEGYKLESISNKLGWKQDAQGRPIMDPRTHQPLVSMTDDVYHTSMQNPYLKVLVDHKVGPDATEGQRRAAMQDLLAPHDTMKYDNKLHDMTKRESSGGGNTPADIEERFKNNEAIVSGFRPDLLASTYDPYQPHQVEYVTRDGKPVVSSKEGNGRVTYYDGQGNVVEKPTKLKVSFSKGGLAYDIEVMRIQDSNLSEDQKKEKMDKLAEQQGKLNTKEFDITTPQGKRAAHHVLSRLLDEPMPPKERQGERYTKKVNTHYGEKATGGVY